MFHAVVPEPLEIHDFCFLDKRLFRQQLELISGYFDVQPLTQAVLRLKAGELSGPTAAITLDDGYYNNFTFAFPELQRLELPASIFVCTGLVDTDQTLWACRILRAVLETPLRSMHWDGRTFGLSDRAEKSETMHRLKMRLKQASPEMLESEVDCIERLLGFEARRPVGADSPFRMLSSAAITHMAESGLVEFGAHTQTHAILSRLTAEEQGREILSSVEHMNRVLQRPCRLFAYPNGNPEDYDEISIGWLRQGGVQVAVTAVEGSNRWSDDSLELRREPIGPQDNRRFLKRRIRRMIKSDKRAAGLNT